MTVSLRLYHSGVTLTPPVAVEGSRTLSLSFEIPTRLVHRPYIGEPALSPGNESDGKGHDGSLFLFELSNRFPEMKGLGLLTNAAFVVRGPLVLTKARLLGLTEKAIFDKMTVNGEHGWTVSTVPRTARGVWGAWDLTLEKDEKRCTVPVCDLPSAAPTDDWQNAFSIWF